MNALEARAIAQKIRQAKLDEVHKTIRTRIAGAARTGSTSIDVEIAAIGALHDIDKLASSELQIEALKAEGFVVNKNLGVLNISW